MRQSSLARTRGGKRPASLARSISHSGCAYDPTSVVGRSMRSLLRRNVSAPAQSCALHQARTRRAHEQIVSKLGSGSLLSIIGAGAHVGWAALPLGLAAHYPSLDLMLRIFFSNFVTSSKVLRLLLQFSRWVLRSPNGRKVCPS